MFDLLVLANSDQLLFILDLYFWQSNLNEEVKRTEPSPSGRGPWCSKFNTALNLIGIHPWHQLAEVFDLLQ